MKNIIIVILVIILGVSVYMNIKSKENTIPTYLIPTTDNQKKSDNKQEIDQSVNLIKPKPSAPKLILTAKANYDQGHIVGGNSQYFDLTITSDADIGASKIIFTQSSQALYPGATPQISQIEKELIINKGVTLIQRVLIAQITKVSINGMNVQFTQTY